MQQFLHVLSAVQDLLTGKKAAQVLGNIGITRLPNDLPSENSLVQLLYAYLVQWVGECAQVWCIATHALLQSVGLTPLAWDLTDTMAAVLCL